MKHQFQIREEKLGDAEEIGYVVQQAFGQQSEANFVVTMREAQKMSPLFYVVPIGEKIEKREKNESNPGTDTSD